MSLTWKAKLWLVLLIYIQIAVFLGFTVVPWGATISSAAPQGDKDIHLGATLRPAIPEGMATAVLCYSFALVQLMHWLCNTGSLCNKWCVYTVLTQACKAQLDCGCFEV